MQGIFMEPPRWELKIPLRVLCILSDDTERMGLPDLRAITGKVTIISYSQSHRAFFKNDFEYHTSSIMLITNPAGTGG